MIMIATIAMAVIAASLCFSLLYTALIVVRTRRIPLRDGNLPWYPKTSIFVTLRNSDGRLEENAASIFALDYPHFDVFFDDIHDPCAKTARRVSTRFPGIASSVVATGNSRGHNPKIDKLASLEGLSDAPLIWVLDSDVWVDPQTLRSLVKDYLDGAKIIFSPIRCRGARSLGGLIEMSYINFFMSGNILAAWDLFRKRIVVGKSLLVEKAALEAIGGFRYFSDILAEDHMLGEVFTRHGFPVRCSDVWIDTTREDSTIRTFFDRMNRWAKLRFNLKKPLYAMEILLNPLALVILFSPVLKTNAFILAAIVVSLRVILEYIVFFSLNAADRCRPLPIAALALAVLIKDLSLTIIYFLPFFGSTVTWRGNTIRIGKETRIILNQKDLLYDNA
jgi:ceramide glucosyltransferase